MLIDHWMDRPDVVRQREQVWRNLDKPYVVDEPSDDEHDVPAFAPSELLDRMPRTTSRGIASHPSRLAVAFRV
jgi:hypothetical protein